MKKQLEKPSLKHAFGNALIIGFSWLFAIGIVYIIWLKVNLLFH